VTVASRLASFALLLCAAAPLAGQGGPAALTLEEAIRRSEEVAPSVVTARGQVRTAELGVRTQYWQYIPQLSFPVNADLLLSSGPSRVDPVTGDIISGNTTNPSYSFGANASLTLFDGFGRTYDMRAARANEVAADAGLISARFQNRLNVTNAFFDALANQELLRVNEAAVGRAQQQLAIASARLQSGAGQRTDSLTALVQLGQARQQLLQAQAALATSEANLARLTGLEGRITAIDDSAFYRQPVLLDTAGIRQEAELASPAIRSSQAALSAAQAQLRSQRSNYWPTISASASNTWTAQKSNDYELEPRRNLRLSFSFSPWTNLQRETQIEQAAINVDTRIATLADQQRQINASLTQFYAALANAREAIEVAQISVRAAQENLRVTEQRYSLGVATVLELTQVQEQVTSAQVQEVTARFNYLTAKAQIEALIGRTLQ
jgi:outer membrane protein